MTVRQYWRVRVWLGEHVIEEYVAPSELAEQYANVLKLRFPGRRLTCEPVDERDAEHLSARADEALRQARDLKRRG